MSDERDFFEDDIQETKICQGFCLYCKDEIFGDDFVDFKGYLYHKDCFILENTNLNPGVNDE